MKEKKFKFFLQSEINRAIRCVESNILSQTEASNTFINLDKLRYLNINLINKLIFGNYAKKDTTLAAFYPINIKSIFRLIRQIIFHRNKFRSSAGIIQIRNNLSLFYFKERFRVKVFMAAGVRSLDAFKNEYYVRKQIESTALLRIPKILAEYFDQEPAFFADEIVYGKTVNWDDPNGTKILKQVLGDLWRFYQTNGISWATLSDKGIDINQMVAELRSCKNKMIKWKGLPLDSILSLSDKYMPSTLIHGDFSLGNIIRTSSANYIVDWELARQDFIIKDLYKTLINKWELFEFLDNLMGIEIKEHFMSERDNAMSLNEQFHLEQFFRMYHQR